MVFILFHNCLYIVNIHMHSAFILSRLHGSTIEHYVIKFVSDFSSDIPDSSTYESDRHDINDILLNVALNTINLTF